MQHQVLRTLIQALSAATGLAAETVAGQVSRPPRAELGDYAFPCFAYAKANKLAPAAAAARLAEQLRAAPALAPLLGSAEAAGAFLNVRFKPGLLCASILRCIADCGAGYGTGREGAGKTIVIDYSGPNIAKPFHVGHLMSTVLGASLVRIFRALGYTVVGVNHLGDWGVQCGYQFLAWQLADPAEREKELAARGLDYLCDLYVDINSAAREALVLEAELANKEVLTDPEERARIKARIEAIKPEADAREARARALFKQMEDGDPDLRKLWERFRRETLAYLQKSYDRLGVKFDSDAGEGFYEPQLKPLLADLQASGVAVESEGALVIPMQDGPLPPGREPKPPFILRKSDEATIYGTRDLAAALYRKKTYDFHKNIYVVDVRQTGHFQMLFKALAKMGHAWHKDCVHVSFGIMQIKEGDTVLPMTTRGGRMIPLNELLDRMVAIVLGIVLEKNPGLASEKAGRVAEAVGVGAIIYWVQARRRTSNFVFDWKQATDPNGDTGPYLQYTHARACSILRKSQAQPESWRGADLALLVEAEELAGVKVLEDFPRVVRQAAESCEPSLVASYLLELASAFGNFLNKHRVLESPPELRRARLALVDAVRHVLATGLGLLGVVAPGEM
ncbi:MAG: arginine--tRNA ligase [Planctomycetota bacterium]